jgi:CRP/FNR family cyclic AMP-dependent transcriptional regulator
MPRLDQEPRSLRHPWPGQDGRFLSALPPATRVRLENLMVVRKVNAGSVIALEGDLASAPFAIARGLVKVTTVNGSGSALLEVCGAGDLLGEEAVLDRGPWMATITAITRTELWSFPAARFDALVKSDAALSAAISVSVMSKLRRATRQRHEFGTYPVTVRVARVLLDLVEAHGAPAHDANGTRIGVALSQSDLGAMVGATEVSAQRALRVLRDHAVIRTAYRSVTVLNLPLLARYAEQDSRRQQAHAAPVRPSWG